MHSKINFTSNGLNVVGNLYLPSGESQTSYPVIIMCHGFCGVKELLLPNFAERFSKEGYAVLTFDYRGFGESEGESGRLVPTLQIEDIHAAVDFVGTLPQVDPTRIALWGTSFGGANAIIAASENSNVQCVVSQLTFSDGEEVITGKMSEEEKEKFLASLQRMREKKDKTGKEMMVPVSKVLSDEQSIAFFDKYKEEFPALNIKIPFLTIWETLNHKPIQSVSDLKVPLLIVAASEDGVNPLCESQRLYQKASEPKELYIEHGATHYEVYTGEHFESVVAHQLDWFKDNL
ncbi:alpha/beta hydrolase [Vibrio sp. S4M6]|uniref:UilS family quorum-quenching N-acyl-homoserine lactonase n=1 Tax=Vibrio sinus TaxID=2946865 RepID=UPI00202A7909|nr:alpha/beta fold hydrolase [Vibrio sinus]MCL9782066.1 alpha/beta hydrolase [Vibrio sinus]